MKVLNDWVGYLDRSYLQIKGSVLNRLATNTPEITDHSDNNPMIIIVSIFAGIAELLNYYIDSMAREAFLETARIYESVIRLVRILDFRIKAAIPATVDLELSFLDSNGDEIIPNTPWPIPAGLIAQGEDYIFQVESDSIMPLGSSRAILPARQIQYLSNYPLGTTQGVKNELVLIGEDYAHGSLRLTIAGESWELVDSFAFSGPFDKVFIVDILTNNRAYIRFGNGIKGMIPPANQIVFAFQLGITEGSDGNNELPNAIEEVIQYPTGLVHPQASPINNSFVRITNPTSPSGGNDYQSIESIREEAPLFVRTLDRAVTYQDYIDIAKLAPGVKYADIEFCCGKEIALYISPDNGGVAQSALLESTANFMDCRKMITTFIDVRPSGITCIKFNIKVYAEFNTDITALRQRIVDALLEFGSYENSDINNDIFSVDIYRVVSNLRGVRRLDISKLKTDPYARPIGDTPPQQLNWQVEINDGASEFSRYEFRFNPSPNPLSTPSFTLLKDDAFIGNVNVNEEYSDHNVTFTIFDSAYSNNMIWEFFSHPHDQDIDIRDFTVPVFREGCMEIEIIPAEGSEGCKPICND